MALISRIRESEGCGVLIIEHDMRLVMNLCDSIHVLDNGKTIATGPPDDIQKTTQSSPHIWVPESSGDGHRRSRGPSANRPRAGAGASLHHRSACELWPGAGAQGRIAQGPPRRDGRSRRAERAGKSTLLLTIAGVLRPIQGSVRLGDDSLVRQAPEDIVRKGVSLVPERRHIFAQLTVEENLKVAAATRTEQHQTRRDLRSSTSAFQFLASAAHRAAGTSPAASSSSSRSPAPFSPDRNSCFVDEPSLGLAPILVERVFDSLAALRDEGVSILLVEQNALATIEMSDRIYVLRRGEIALEGEGTDATIRTDIVKSYIDQLGLDVQTTSAA